MSWELIITSVVTIFAGIFASNGFWSYKMSKRIGESAEKKMIMGLTYVTIVKHCEYWKEQGWVDPDDLRDLQHYLYEPYKELGGNGTAERLFTQASQLPSKPPKGE